MSWTTFWWRRYCRLADPPWRGRIHQTILRWRRTNRLLCHDHRRSIVGRRSGSLSCSTWWHTRESITTSIFIVMVWCIIIIFLFLCQIILNWSRISPPPRRKLLYHCNQLSKKSLGTASWCSGEEEVDDHQYQYNTTNQQHHLQRLGYGNRAQVRARSNGTSLSLGIVPLKGIYKGNIRVFICT